LYRQRFNFQADQGTRRRRCRKCIVDAGVAAKMDRSSISKIENGKKNPILKVIHP
jgi:DNA-binding XRE family transcriptional regulator